jgi:hypothetical protein
MARAIQLAAREVQPGGVELVFDLVPQRGIRQGLFDAGVAVAVEPLDLEAVGDVVVDALRERVRFLEHLTDVPAERDGVGGWSRACPGPQILC